MRYPFPVRGDQRSVPAAFVAVGGFDAVLNVLPGAARIATNPSAVRSTRRSCWRDGP